MIVRITKEFSFETSHQLENYDGKCRNIHGHSYKLFITVIGTPIDDPKSPKYGMLIDFTDLKKIVNDQIVEPFDHALVLPKPSKTYDLLKSSGTKLMMTEYQPTCENMVGHFASIIKPLLPQNVRLYSIKLYETATSYAEWVASDNE